MIRPERNEARRIVSAPTGTYAKSREREARVSQYKGDNIEVEAGEGEPGMGCLRCRACSLLPHTDFSRLVRPDGSIDEDATTPVFCGKVGRAVPVRLHGCSRADPRLKFGSDGKKKPSGAGTGGDRTRNCSPVENAFAVVAYPRAPWEQLQRLMGRSHSTLRAMEYKHAWPARAVAASLEIIRRNAATALRARQESGRAMNAAQVEYITGCYERGFWPLRGGYRSAERLAEFDRIRAEIVARVNELDTTGRVREWRHVCDHVKNTSPGARRSSKQWARQRRAEFGSSDLARKLTERDS